MERNRSLFETLVNQDFDEYLEKIKDEREWVGDVEMKALSLKYKIDFVVYYDISKPPLKIKAPSSIQTVRLACTGGNRYDCVYSKSELSALAFCQSIVYEVLYKRVFELGSDVDVAVEKMLHDKAYSKQRRNNLLCHYFRESCRIDGGIEDPNLPEDDQELKSIQDPRLEIRKALAQGVPPFPYKVAKTLDPNIYRNVEFDMWNEKRKEDQKNEQFIVPKLEPGVKCKVHINKDIYIGHVQDIFNDNESVSIYIEELCKRCIVSTSVLEIVPVPAYKGSGVAKAEDVQALTWQGGKTYKVYSDCMQVGSDTDKNKNKRGYKKNNQEYSPNRNCGSNHLKPSVIARSNSMPTSSGQRNTFSRSNTLCSPPQLSRKKGNSFSASQKPKTPMQQKDSRNGQFIRPPQNYPCVWNGVVPNLPTSPIPIPGKIGVDCYPAQSESPEILNDIKDPTWNEDSYKSPPPFSPTQQQHYAIAYTTSDPVYQVVSAPLPIPGVGGECGGTPPPPAEECPPLAVYPYPVYAVPGMYLVCRDGTTLTPVGVGGGWSENGELAATQGIPSVYFNTPPAGMTPPVGSWIPAYPPGWSPAYTPPVEAYISPPWSPQQYMPPPNAIYQHQMQQQPPVAQQESAAQN